MDEEKISIVLQEKYAMNQESYISLYCINIDLVSGELLDNGEMIEYNEQLAKEFRVMLTRTERPRLWIGWMTNSFRISFRIRIPILFSIPR